jgi:hypothetical protein
VYQGAKVETPNSLVPFDPVRARTMIVYGHTIDTLEPGSEFEFYSRLAHIWVRQNIAHHHRFSAADINK